MKNDQFENYESEELKNEDSFDDEMDDDFDEYDEDVEVEKESGVIPYLIDITKLQALQGSGNYSVIAALKKSFKTELERIDKELILLDSDYTSEDLLKAFLDDTAADIEDPGDYFQQLLAMLCHQYGTPLSNEYWNPSNWDFELWYEMEHFNMDIPLNIPPENDTTFLGIFLPREDIKTFLKEVDYKPAIMGMLEEDNESFQANALKEFEQWFKEAEKSKLDIFLFIESYFQ